MKLYSAVVVTPVGPVVVTTDREGALIRCATGVEDVQGPEVERVAPDGERCGRAVEEILEYFDGKRTHFTVAVRPFGTEFQQIVWRALLDIPYGTTISYRELARRVGRPKAVRAVGGANGANPVAIIIPCHRVIGSDGSLTGYGGGLEMKRRLLDLERRAIRESA